MALLVQMGGWVWWAGSQAAQISSLDHRLVAVETREDILISHDSMIASKTERLEERLADLSAAVKNADAHLAAIESYLNTLIRSGGINKKQ